MKRIVIVEILLMLILSVLLAFCIKSFTIVSDGVKALSTWSGDGYFANLMKEDIRTWSIYGSLSIIAMLATLAVMIVIAIKDFPVFKPLVDKLNAKRAVRKEARSQAKAEQAAIAKQERIEQLKAELDELQKDE